MLRDYGGGVGRGKMYQCMAFRFLEVVAAVEWVEPGVQEELGPFSAP